MVTLISIVCFCRFLFVVHKLPFAIEQINAADNASFITFLISFSSFFILYLVSFY